MANVPPPEGPAFAQARIIVDAVKESVAELKSDVKEIKGHRHTDFVWIIGVLAAGFLVLLGAMATAYLRLDDKVSELSKSQTRIETRLEDLIARIPPTQTPVPKK
jgi:hypothetical protein